MAEERIIRIGIIGAESTGKSWLCERLAMEFATGWRPEAAREYFRTRRISDCTPDDLEELGRMQEEREAGLLESARRYLFCDTTFITLRIWGLLEFGGSTPELDLRVKKESYDLYLLTSNDVAWQEDELRFNTYDREMIRQMNLDELQKKKAVYRVVEGLGEERFRSAKNAVKEVFGDPFS